MKLIDVDALEIELLKLLLNGDDKMKFVADVAPLISNAPTVDAVPVVHGKWEFVDKNKVQCSVCFRIRNGKIQRMWEYCPNCGAKMD